MHLKKIAVALAGGVALSIAGITPASAHEGHRSCEGFGRTVAGAAQYYRPLGQELTLYTPVNDDFAEVHAVNCEPAP